ncbi:MULTISPECIES: hypothetical protein [unclassified Lysobacter]|uniref:hypothetical protein n=1 Tax=unclassified Lysobacter TaxID=2635362 RepID=UPI001BEB6F58|nr:MULTISPECIES: hypothetical protein [unclassified Lysobacter]MBT2748181.1 hypothetical protein [Lysobacter sp. ISL-42]MBT2751130.1 hypothetical protein [Lysobacter sp. ISL-50]MBT2779917.1 hypothetical protein [Lysobacter sp. ISL-54]MBT2781874.1 hypothetical protein [Lysobacter sp. ISL-52]
MSDNKAPFVPAQAATLLKSGNKIQAIKLVLDSNPGIDLRQAKDAVENYERRLAVGALAASAVAANAASVQTAKTGFPEAAREAVQRGQTIVAIKIVREAYGLDLRQAKQLVEAYLEKGEAALGGVAAPANSRALQLPAEVLMLVLKGEHARAAQLLQTRFGHSAADAVSRVADYEVTRKKRGVVGDSGRTVSPGDNNGGMLLAAALIAIVLVLIGYFVAG